MNESTKNVASLPTAGKIKVDDVYGPFHPKPLLWVYEVSNFIQKKKKSIQHRKIMLKWTFSLRRVGVLKFASRKITYWPPLLQFCDFNYLNVDHIADVRKGNHKPGAASCLHGLHLCVTASAAYWAAFGYFCSHGSCVLPVQCASFLHLYMLKN